jgi:hypothetical protein
MTPKSTTEPEITADGLVLGTGPNRLPTVDEAALAAQRSPRWVRMEMDKGKIRYTRIGRTPYPVQSFLNELLATNEVAPVAAAARLPRRTVSKPVSQPRLMRRAP